MNKIIKLNIILIIIIIITIIVLSILGNKTRTGYLTDFNLDIGKTLYFNNITNKFILTNSYDLKKAFILTNCSIKYYDFKLRYNSKIFRNSDIYSVYINNFDEIKKNNNFIQEINIKEKGSPFGFIISNKILDSNIDNIKYILKVKNIHIYFLIVLILLLITIFNSKYKSYVFNINILFSNNKKYSIIISILFFILMSVSEVKLYNNETAKEFLHSYTLRHPHYYERHSLFLNHYFWENTNNYPNRIEMSKYRRDIKEKNSIYIDKDAENNILGNIYSRFISPRMGATNFATMEDYNTPTLYSSHSLLITKIIYFLMPIKHITSYELELKASYYWHYIKMSLLLINIFLYSVLIYLISSKYNILYSIILFISIFCFPGSSVIIQDTYFDQFLVALFPIYVLIVYDPNSSMKKKILFHICLSILIFIQWSLMHYSSLIIILPIILLTIAFINFNYQYKTNNQNNISNIIIEHIKKFSLNYIIIISYTLLITVFVLFLSYEEQIKLQPENKEIIYNHFVNRASEDKSKLSLALLDLAGWPKDWSENMEKYYITYSLDNFIKHHKRLLSIYFNYPSIYPLWRLEQFTNTKISDFLYKIKFSHINLLQLLISILALNIFILVLKKDKIKLLLTPLIFLLSSLIWIFILFDIFPRLASTMSYAHMINQYIVIIYLYIVVYLLDILVKKDN